MNIILRHASSDLDALLTARAMENSGCTVFSITSYPETRTKYPVSSVNCTHIVWAKFPVDASHPDFKDAMDKMDEAISKAIYPERKEPDV